MSDSRSPTPRRRGRFFSIAAIGVIALLPIGNVLASIRTSSRNIVVASGIVREDLYAFGGRTIIEGTIEGDLFVVGGELTITGTVEGDVVGLVGGPARISGTVGGSVLVAAVSLQITGDIGADVASLVGDATVGGTVDRDVLLIGGETVVSATVGRDLRAQVWRLVVEGDIGRKVIARVDDIVVADAARVGDDVSFKASDVVDVSDGAEIGGALIRRSVITPVWAQAFSRAVTWLSLLALLVSGTLLFWLFRRTATRAPDIVGERPWRATLIGLAVLLGAPALTLPLLLSLVGIPLAILILLTWVVALVLGPAPALAWAGRHLLRSRGGVLAAFVVAALLWRAAMWLLPAIGLLLYLAAVAPGIGSFVMAALEARRESRPLGESAATV